MCAHIIILLHSRSAVKLAITFLRNAVQITSVEKEILEILSCGMAELSTGTLSRERLKWKETCQSSNIFSTSLSRTVLYIGWNLVKVFPPNKLEEKKNLHLSLHYNYLTQSGNRKTETNCSCVRVCLAHCTKTGTQKTQLARGLAVFVSHYKLLSCVCVFMAEKTQTNSASVPWSIKLWLILPVMWKQRVYKMPSRDRGVI